MFQKHKTAWQVVFCSTVVENQNICSHSCVLCPKKLLFIDSIPLDVLHSPLHHAYSNTGPSTNQGSNFSAVQPVKLARYSTRLSPLDGASALPVCDLHHIQWWFAVSCCSSSWCNSLHIGMSFLPFSYP